MSANTLEASAAAPTKLVTPAPLGAEEKLTKKALTADHPTWCPGCGDFAVLAAFYKVLDFRKKKRSDQSNAILSTSNTA